MEEEIIIMPRQRKEVSSLKLSQGRFPSGPAKMSINYQIITIIITVKCQHFFRLLTDILGIFPSGSPLGDFPLGDADKIG